MYARGAEAYLRLSVTTAPTSRLIVLLYQQALRSTRQGIEALERRELAAAHNALVRAQGVLFELQSTVDPATDPLAADLDALYTFFRQNLIEANLQKDAAPAGRVAEMLESLLDAWKGPASSK